MPDKKTAGVGVGGIGGGGGKQPMMVPINIVCAPEPMQNDLKTVCSFSLFLSLSIHCFVSLPSNYFSQSRTH